MKHISNRYFFFLFILCQALFLSSQNDKISASLDKLKNDGADTTKVIHLLELCHEFRYVADYDKSMDFAKQALQLSKELKYKYGLANAYSGIANANYGQANYLAGLENQYESMKIRELLCDKKGMAETYHNLGALYDKLGDFSRALQNYSISLVMDEEIGDWKNAIITSNNIGVIYERKGDYSKAISNYFEALKKVNNTSHRSTEVNFNEYQNIGNVYLHQGNYEEASKQYNLSLEFEKRNKNNQGIADSYNNLGVVCSYQKKYNEALKKHFLSLDLKKEIGDKQGITVSYCNVANVYKKQENYIKALEIQFQALSLQEMIGDKYGICISWIMLGELQTMLNKPKDAENYINKALLLSKELANRHLELEAYRAYATLNNVLSGSPRISYKQKEKYMLKAINYYKLWVVSIDSIHSKN